MTHCFVQTQYNHHRDRLLSVSLSVEQMSVEQFTVHTYIRNLPYQKTNIFQIKFIEEEIDEAEPYTVQPKLDYYVYLMMNQLKLGHIYMFQDSNVWL